MYTVWIWLVVLLPLVSVVLTFAWNPIGVTSEFMHGLLSDPQHPTMNLVAPLHARVPGQHPPRLHHLRRHHRLGLARLPRAGRPRRRAPVPLGLGVPPPAGLLDRPLGDRATGGGRPRQRPDLGEHRRGRHRGASERRARHPDHGGGPPEHPDPDGRRSLRNPCPDGCGTSVMMAVVRPLAGA